MSMDRFANIIVRRLMCMLSIGMLAGCSFRPLTDPEYNTYVRIKVNTDNIRNVTSDIYNEDIERPEIAPEVMHVLFYEPDGNSLVAESFASENSVDEDGYTWISGYMSLVPGDYRMLAYNFGTEGTTVDGYGNDIPNFHYETVMKIIEGYMKTGLKNPAIIIDANHSNSGKQFKQQIRIVEEVLNNRLYDADFKKYVKGFMIESFIEEGCQKEDVIYGKSITDPCLGWEDTERLVLDIAEKV